MNYLKDNLPVYNELLQRGYKPEDFTEARRKFKKDRYEWLERVVTHSWYGKGSVHAAEGTLLEAKEI